MARRDMDSVTLAERDKAEAEALRKIDPRTQRIVARSEMLASTSEKVHQLNDTEFTDPGKKYASIHNPKIYEALRKKGYSKSKAARISNAK